MQQLRWYETLCRRMVDAHIQNTNVKLQGMSDHNYSVLV